MTEIAGLFEKIRRDHSFFPPLPAERVRELESELDYALPTDLKEFYSFCNGAVLFGGDYAFPPLEDVRRVRIDIFGADIDFSDGTTATWYSVCDIRDGDYIAAGLASVNDDHCWILECDREDLDPARIIALSFTEFLGKALASAGSNFWQMDDYPGYGYTPDGGPPGQATG